MEMKISEVLDRWTILLMKAKFDDTAKKELEIYDGAITNLLTLEKTSNITFLKILLELMEGNAKIWEQEAGIRNEFPKDPSSVGVDQKNYSEIGRRAILIREHNKNRVQAKAKIDKLFNQLPDVKVGHASE
jgi:hypothetical protein